MGFSIERSSWIGVVLVAEFYCALLDILVLTPIAQPHTTYIHIMSGLNNHTVFYKGNHPYVIIQGECTIKFSDDKRSHHWKEQFMHAKIQVILLHVFNFCLSMECLAKRIGCPDSHAQDPISNHDRVR